MSEERIGPETEAADDLDTLEEDIDLDDGEGDEPEPEGEGDDGEPDTRPAAQPEEPPPRRESRTERQIRTLRARTQQAEREARELRQAQTQLLTQFRPPAPQPDPYRQQLEAQQEQERLLQMAPHEVAAYYANKTRTDMQHEIARISVQMGDNLDRQGFQTFAASRPHAQRLTQKVEEYLAAARQQNMNPTRQAIYHLLLGQEVDAKTQREGGTQRRNGRARIAAATTQPGSARSNVPAERRRREDSDADLDRRLSNVTWGDVVSGNTW